MPSDKAGARAGGRKEYRPQALVCDIGRTHMRFALTDLDEMTIANYALLRTDLFASPLDALAAYLKTTPERPEHVGMALSGDLSGGTAGFAGAEWIPDRDAIRRLTGAGNIELINRYEALALALPHLQGEDLTSLGGKSGAADTPLAVIVPGTGLNVAALIRTGQADIPVSGLGGLVGFAPETIAEFELVQSLAGDMEFVPAEALISTSGIVSVYQLLRKQNGRAVEAVTSADVAAAAALGDADARRAIDLFSIWLGRFAGDVALTVGARGGVFIGGSVATNIAPALQAGAFRAAFEKKGRMSAYLSEIQVHVIRTPNAGLKGAAVAARAASSL